MHPACSGLNDHISAHGKQIAAVQELIRRIAALKVQIAKLKGKRK
jgi:uncharacterized small protein (DUF1192 family)